MKQPQTLPINDAAPIGIGFGDLLGCPFCGGKAYFRDTYDCMSGWGDKNIGWVACSHCHITTPDKGFGNYPTGLPKHEAIALWNNRDTNTAKRETEHRMQKQNERESLNSASL